MGLLAVVVGLGACSGTDDEGTDEAVLVGSPSDSATSDDQTRGNQTGTDEPSTDEPSAPASPTVDTTVADGFTTPWGIAFLPDGTALVSERDTAAIKAVSGDGRVTTVGRVPGVNPSSEGGLLGLAVAPGQRDPVWVYAYYSGANDNRVVRMSYDGDRLGRPQLVLDGIPMSDFHNGGRVEFGPDGMLYISTGDATEGGNATDPDSLGGKILRVTPAGEPAPGNPTAGSPVWTSGHRNVQGIAWDDEDRLWASEFGQDTWDELNAIEPGNNYGWPDVEGKADEPGATNPQVQWRPEAASPSGVAFASGALWMAGLRGERLWRMEVAGGAVTGQPRAFLTEEYGRLRTVVAAPDGSLWLSTSNTDGRGNPRDGDDKILRLDVGAR
ncbi:PQQ-dependent sugar dehydrogenase [soil metagenome]